MRISPNYKNSGTHIPTLLRFIPLTDGDVCEMGVGFNSTPLLHWLCQGRNLVSYEGNADYYKFARQYQSKNHKVRFVPDWKKVDFDRHWSVVFIDHSNRPRTRGDDAVKFKNADLIILHDTEPESLEHYGYEQVFKKFKYHYTWDKCKPFTSVVSNVIDVSQWLK